MLFLKDLFQQVSILGLTEKGQTLKRRIDRLVLASSTEASGFITYS